MDAMTTTRLWGLPCPIHSRPSPKPCQATPGLSAEPGHRETQALATPTPYPEPRTLSQAQWPPTVSVGPSTSGLAPRPVCPHLAWHPCPQHTHAAWPLTSPPG